MIDVEIMRPFPAAFDLAFHFTTYHSVLVVSSMPLILDMEEFIVY